MHQRTFEYALGVLLSLVAWLLRPCADKQCQKLKKCKAGFKQIYALMFPLLADGVKINTEDKVCIGASKAAEALRGAPSRHFTTAIVT